MSEGVTLSQYAKLKGITIQGVSQVFKRHREEMAGMFLQKGRAIVLNEDGVKYLDGVRAKLPVTAAKPETMTALKDTVNMLQKQHEDDMEEIRRLQERVKDLEQLTMEKDRLIAFKDNVIMRKDEQLLLTTSQGKKGIIQKLREWVTGTDGKPLPEEVHSNDDIQ